MKIPFEWLSQFLDLSEVTPEELAEQLSLKAFEVEDVQYIGPRLTGPLVSGKILEISKHPNADKLQVTKTQVAENEEPRQIVCGAKNIEVGQIVPVALPGAIVINRTNGEPLAIKVGKIRDVESHGMLCSAAEIGLDGNDGILILDSKLPVGKNLIEELKLKQSAILNVASRSNRGDALSIQGIAREAAATIGKPLSLDLYKEGRETAFLNNIKQLKNFPVEANQAVCQEVGFLRIKGVRVAPSPDWLCERLKAAGISSINNIVDITNYVMLEIGQPMHAYDANKLNWQNGFKIDFASQTGSFAALDGNSYEITKENLMVSETAGKALALAGVMGGAESAISEQSTEIVLEAACFEAKVVRRSSRLTGIATESSRRFERGTDPELVKIALMRAYELIQETAGGEAEAYGYLSTSEAKHAPALNLSFKKFNELTGHTIAPTRAEEILSKLGFRIIQVTDKFIQVDVPSFRQKDVGRPIDLIEELARFEGLNEIQASPLPGVQSFLPESDSSLNLKKILVAQGLLENISGSLVAENYELTTNTEQLIKMRNPLSKEHTQLRTSLIPGLLKAAAHNYRRQQSSVRLFEFGKVYFKESNKSFEENVEKTTNTREIRSLGLLISGKSKQFNWQGNLHSADDFYELKGLIELICLKKGQLVFSQLDANKHNFLHPTAAATLSLNGQVIGVIGTIHPLYAKKFEVPEGTFLAEINLEKLPEKVKFKLKPLSDQPIMSRDFTADLPQNSQVSFEDIQKVIQACKLNNLEESSLVSLYKNQESGALSISFRLIFQGKDASLTNDEINLSLKQLREALNKKLPAVSFRE